MLEHAAVQTVLDRMTLNYVYAASLTLLTYDTLLTLSHEIDYIWNKRFKLGAALYLLARYPKLLFLVLRAIGRFLNLPSFQSCEPVGHLAQSVDFLTFIATQGLLLARAYAVTDHKRVVLIVLTILSGCVIAPELVVAVTDRCVITSTPSHIFIILEGINWIASILFETVVVVVTLACTLGTWRVHRQSTYKLPLTHLLARQGLTRYGIMLTIHIFGAIFSLGLRPFFEEAIEPIGSLLSAIIVCRLHLELQGRAYPKTNTLRLSTISIGSFHVATQRIHDAVMGEFGDQHPDMPVRTEALGQAIVSADVPATATGDGIWIQSHPRGAEVTLAA